MAQSARVSFGMVHVCSGELVAGESRSARLIRVRDARSPISRGCGRAPRTGWAGGDKLISGASLQGRRGKRCTAERCRRLQLERPARRRGSVEYSRGALGAESTRSFGRSSSWAPSSEQLRRRVGMAGVERSGGNKAACRRVGAATLLGLRRRPASGEASHRRMNSPPPPTANLSPSSNHIQSESQRSCEAGHAGSGVSVLGTARSSGRL